MEALMNEPTPDSREPEEAAASPPPRDDDTQPLEPVPAAEPTVLEEWEPLLLEDENKPGWAKRFIHSVPFYMIVMIILVSVAWLLDNIVIAVLDALSTEEPPASIPALEGVALCVTAFAVLVIGLRFIRGSVLKVRQDLRYVLYADAINGVRPSNRLADRLFKDESVLWESKLHPLSILPIGLNRLRRSKRGRIVTLTILALLALATASNPAGGIGLAVVVVASYVAYCVLEWSRDRYALTDNRIMAVVGLFKTRVPSMPRARFTDIVVTTSAFANLLAWLRLIKMPYGQFDVESAGQDQALKYIDFVPAADAVAAALDLGKIAR
jgi:hypothetical protein